MEKVAPDGTAYDLTGPDGAPVLALIHGLGLCRHVWDGLLQDFAQYRVLNYDLYGHGDSAPTRDTASLAVYSDQLAGLMDHLGIATATVIGFSVGGMINRRFALDHGERLDALVILNSPHDRGDAAQAHVEARALAARDQGAMATMGAALKRWFTPGYLTTGTGADQVRDWRARADPES
jgi:pimeloyl-ACP methyl ester carboxylesterase